MLCCADFFSHWFLVPCFFQDPILRVEPYILCHVFTPKFIYPGLTTRTLGQR